MRIEEQNAIPSEQERNNNAIINFIRHHEQLFQRADEQKQFFNREINYLQNRGAQPIYDLPIPEDTTAIASFPLEINDWKNFGIHIQKFDTHAKSNIVRMTKISLDIVLSQKDTPVQTSKWEKLAAHLDDVIEETMYIWYPDDDNSYPSIFMQAKNEQHMNFSRKPKQNSIIIQIPQLNYCPVFTMSNLPRPLKKRWHVL